MKIRVCALAALAFVCLLAAPPSTTASPPPPPTDADRTLAAALALARTAQAYRITADADQTLVPRAVPGMAGQQDQTLAVSLDTEVSGPDQSRTTLAFDPTTGQLVSGGSISVTVAGASVAVDLSTVTGFAGLTTIEAQGQDGEPAGTLQAFTATSDGTLIGSFSNGLKQAVGRLALANFANPMGLEKAGSSLFRTSVNSGDPQVGEPRTGGRGILTGGALEMSNVDLSQEFTNLIIAQRGFQAGSRVITTSDELLQELVNLKR